MVAAAAAFNKFGKNGVHNFFSATILSYKCELVFNDFR